MDAAVEQYGPPGFVVTGGCRTGVDHFSALWCQTRGAGHDEMPADWDTYKLAAAPIRNRAMLDRYPNALVLAVPTETSKGTADMVNETKHRGRPQAVACPDGTWACYPGVTQQTLW